MEGKGGGDRARPRGSLLPLPLEPFFSPPGGTDCGGCCWEPDRGAGGFFRGIQDCRPLQLQLQGQPVSFLELAASSPCPVVPLLVELRPSVRPSVRTRIPSWSSASAGEFYPLGFSSSVAISLQLVFLGYPISFSLLCSVVFPIPAIELSKLRFSTEEKRGKFLQFKIPRYYSTIT